MEISEILVSFSNADEEKMQTLKYLCRGQNITLKKAELKIEAVELD